jgi:hypothetical protein
LTGAPRFRLLAVAAPAGLVGAVLIAAVALALLGSSAGASGCAAETEAVGTVNAKEVPPRLIPIYQQAAAQYHLGEQGPAVLAAINYRETSFGTDLGESSAGAEGWMQFEPESWTDYGVDADGDGIKNPDDPWDAIFAAARLLRADGAPGDWRGAIWDYNHADWYVNEVLALAQKYAAPTSPAAEVASVCPSGGAGERVAAMIAEATRLSRLRPTTEYTWGGSHTLSPTPANGPFDCSSAVSHLLQVGGFHNETMATIALDAWGEPGPGQLFTVLVKPYEPEAHTVIEFMPGVTPPSERYWGTSGLVEPGHGPGWIPESVFPASYLTRFDLRHAPGF